MVSDIDKAWLAGIVEGEGSLIVWRQKNCDSVAFRLAIYNSNALIASEAHRLLEAILESKVRISTVRRANRHRNQYVVAVESRAKVAHVVRTLLPFIRGKRHEAEILLAIYALTPNRSGGWNRWGRRIPLSKEVDVLLRELSESRCWDPSVGNPEPSCAGAIGSAEGATTSSVTPEDNPSQERAASLFLPGMMR